MVIDGVSPYNRLHRFISGLCTCVMSVCISPGLLAGGFLSGNFPAVSCGGCRPLFCFIVFHIIGLMVAFMK